MYFTDLSDSQWQVIEKLIEKQRKRKYDLREIVNALIYILKTGCQWRMLPNDLPPYPIVFYYFKKWKNNHTLEQINKELLSLRRVQLKQNQQPSLCIIDSQSVKNSERGLPDKSYDGYKKINGRKRHIAVDKNGYIMAVHINEAGRHDSQDAESIIKKMKELYKSVKVAVGDSAYKGKLIKQLKNKYKIVLKIVKAIKSRGFKVAAKRWIVERTFSWMNYQRRLSKDYEALFCSAAAFVYLFNLNLMLKNF